MPPVFGGLGERVSGYVVMVAVRCEHVLCSLFFNGANAFFARGFLCPRFDTSACSLLEDEGWVGF